VSKLLGHTSLTTTSRYLMNMQRAAMRRAVDRLERAAAQPAPDVTSTFLIAPDNLQEFANGPVVSQITKRCD
jgi:hypothetical protein